MSYCRCSDSSDVYVYPTMLYSTPIWVIDFCEGKKKVVALMKKHNLYNVAYTSRGETLEALNEARELGFKVPQYAIDRLKREIEEERSKDV